MKHVYFDHNATTPLDERVFAAMLPYLRDQYGNASSRHEFGTLARKAVNEARQQVAALVGVQPVQIVFTSGGTESNNAFVKGAAGMLKPSQIAVSANIPGTHKSHSVSVAAPAPSARSTPSV